MKCLQEALYGVVHAAVQSVERLKPCLTDVLPDAVCFACRLPPPVPTTPSSAAVASAAAVLSKQRQCLLAAACSVLCDTIMLLQLQQVQQLRCRAHQQWVDDAQSSCWCGLKQRRCAVV
jgi:hypothetical protein